LNVFFYICDHYHLFIKTKLGHMTLTVPSLDICHAGSCACLTQPDLIRIASAVRSEVRTAPKFEQGNGRLHFPRVVHSSHPFPGDRRCGLSSTCRRRTSHGHRQHAQKFGKDRACGSGDILSDRQTHTDRQIDRQTDATDAIDHNTSPPLRSKYARLTSDFFV